MLLVGAAVLVIAPTVARTYVLLSPARHWPVSLSTCITRGHVSIADADQGMTAVADAINSAVSWNSAGSGNVINATLCPGTAWTLGDGNPVISLQRQIGGCNGSCLAATYVGYYDCTIQNPDGTCVIWDSDVEGMRNKADRYGGPYYDANEACTSGQEWNAEAIWVHESGHQLGLGHTNVAGATMYPSVSSCNNGGASIAQDDADGLNALY
jgi:hypothetical protein